MTCSERPVLERPKPRRPLIDLLRLRPVRVVETEAERESGAPLVESSSSGALVRESWWLCPNFPFTAVRGGPDVAAETDLVWPPPIDAGPNIMEVKRPRVEPEPVTGGEVVVSRDVVERGGGAREVMRRVEACCSEELGRDFHCP